VVQHTHNRLTLSGFCLGQPGWAGARRNVHPLTPILVISRPLYASSIYYDQWHPSCSIYVSDSLFPQSVSKFYLVFLLTGYPPLHTPYITSPNDCLFFVAHAHTIAACFAVVLRLCHLILVSLSTHQQSRWTATPSWLIGAPLSSIPIIFMPDALPGTHTCTPVLQQLICGCDFMWSGG